MDQSLPRGCGSSWLRIWLLYPHSCLGRRKRIRRCLRVAILRSGGGAGESGLVSLVGADRFGTLVRHRLVAVPMEFGAAFERRSRTDRNRVRSAYCPRPWPPELPYHNKLTGSEKGTPFLAPFARRFHSRSIVKIKRLIFFLMASSDPCQASRGWLTSTVADHSGTLPKFHACSPIKGF